MRDASPVRWIAAAMMTTCVLSGDAVGADARAKADISCRPAANKLQYDCTIKLTDARTDEPLTGVELTVGADMPSMPLAHNVLPPQSTPPTTPRTSPLHIHL